MKLIYSLIISVALSMMSAHAADTTNPKKCPLITTETFADVPSDRTRKILGVGEGVTITTTEKANWRLESGPKNTTLDDPKDNVSSVSFNAGDYNGPAVVVAHIVSMNLDCKVTFQIISPNHLTFHDPNPIFHTLNTTSGGFRANRIHIHPDTVSFYNTRIREGAAVAAASGVWSNKNGVVHDPGTEIMEFLQDNNSKAGTTDDVWIGGIRGVSGAGTFRWGIPLTYGCNGDDPALLMGTIVQIAVANTFGDALISKGDLNVPVPLSAPHVPYSPRPRTILPSP